MNEQAVASLRAASILPRVAAYGIDSLVIAAYVAVSYLVGSRAGPADASAWQAHLRAFLFLTLPMVVSFAALEASGWRATPGKRLAGLRVADAGGGRASIAQTLVRNALKFLPWELSHTAIHRIDGWPLDPAPLATWQLASFSLAYALVLLWLASLWWGRTPYDALAGVRVVRAAPIRERATGEKQ